MRLFLDLQKARLSLRSRVACLSGALLLTLVCQSNLAIGQLAPNSRYQSLLSYGSAAPVGGQTFTAFTSTPVMSANGNWIAFEALHTPFGAIDQGIFRYSTATGAVNTIISKGDAVPGGTFNMLLSGRRRSVTNLGTVGFDGTIGGATLTTDTGLYYGSGSGVTELLREGNTAPGGLGGVYGNIGTGVGFTDIQFRGLNDLNQAMFTTQVIASPGGAADDYRFIRTGPSGQQAIAVEGGIGPGGVTFANFTGVEMNDVGGAIMTGNSTGGVKIWYMDPSGTMSDLVTALPGGGTGTSVGTIKTISAGQALLNNPGDVVFSGWTSSGGTGLSDTYVFRTSTAGGTPTVMLAENTAAPNGAGGFNGVFADITYSNPHLNDDGQFAAGLSLRTTTGGVTDDTGIFRVDSNGTVTQMFREGQAALTGNGTFGSMSGGVPFAFNNSGNIAMMTNYLGTSGGASDNTAIVITDGIDSFEVAREGKLVGSETIVSLDFANSLYGNDRSTSGLNDYGQVVYAQGLSGINNRSIELWTPELHHRGGVSNFDDRLKWTLSLKPAHVHDVFLDSSVNSTVTLSGTQSVRNLTVGGGAGTANLQFVSNGTLIVSDTLSLKANGSIDLAANTSMNLGRLEGIGTINGTSTSTITVADALSPGMSPGQLFFSGAMTLGSAATTEIELGGATAGLFDQVLGLSSLTLNGTLDVSLFGGFSLAAGQQFKIFDVVGSSSTTGMFTGLNEGSLVGNFGGTDLFISYTGGDVTLYTTAVPEPSGLCLIVAAGFTVLGRRRRISSRNVN